jgi:hypothetical protein
VQLVAAHLVIILVLVAAIFGLVAATGFRTGLSGAGRRQF